MRNYYDACELQHDGAAVGLDDDSSAVAHTQPVSGAVDCSA